MIQGVNHVTLAIRDVEASFAFYTQVLGFRPVAKWPKGAYLLAGDTWIALQQDVQTRRGRCLNTRISPSACPVPISRR